MGSLKKIKHKLIRKISNKIKSSKKNLVRFSWFANQVSPETIVILDYPIKLSQRYTLKEPHEKILNLIEKNKAEYKSILENFLKYEDRLKEIASNKQDIIRGTDPTWDNIWLPGLDGVSIYGFIALMRPKLFLEIGSGNSTKFAFKAIKDNELTTKVVSIDPHPREEIDIICDSVIRSPLEEVDLKIFDQLEENDILFIDNSHRVFMNSDVTTVFLDIIPRLKKGVIIQIHDIFLPYDYPDSWIERYYSEQYMLASYILANPDFFEILMPSFFISNEIGLKSVFDEFWDSEGFENIPRHGQSFWLRIK
ncbi:Methyltransferase domain-containing protein [Algoriphagus ornithinivorans]|uniref:Methyltransferase domain-containing protein n=1 Tax=Algoriphagus ornithinivorans TaxID=226506 RepID=A0A1I5HHY7_9BACT|nr:class I SAM-dependent methyltransferase [Algoriphagus ornithinivorans]SFO47875.1 Methyltransferase domain-containing protein [Algoriphagus ornithinivorans]